MDISRLENGYGNSSSVNIDNNDTNNNTSSSRSPNDINKGNINTSSPIKSVTTPHGRLEDGQLRILIFTACYFVLDGVTLTIRRLESYLRSRGATVRIVSTVPDDFDAEQIKDMIVVPSIKIPFAQAGSGYAFGAGLDNGAKLEMESFKPNCIHFTVPDLVGLDGVKWCQENNIAYMATWHSNYCEYLKYYFLEWAMKPILFRHLQGFFEQMPTVYVPTPYIRDKMQREGFGQQCDLKEWGRGVDLNLFSPDRRSEGFRSIRGIEADDVVILWVGRLVPEKRPDIWMNVVQRLQMENRNVKAMVVGHGTYEATLSSQLDNVTCCGWLSGTALAEAYASADILLFPSAVETFGNVTLEALASGAVCIVEDLCGGHLVDHGHNGYVCPSGDSEKFYQATKRIVEDHYLRQQMSKHARQSAWKFERSKILQMMAENYKDAIEKFEDPTYMKQRVANNPAVAGQTVLNTICCNYWFVRTFAEPILNTTSSFQNFAHSTQDCVSHSRFRFSCSDIRGSLEDDWEDYKLDRDHHQAKRKTWCTSLYSWISSRLGQVCSYVPCNQLQQATYQVIPHSSAFYKYTGLVALVLSYIIISLFFYASFLHS